MVAQKAATLQLLSEGRFILGLRSGENLNEHITREGWPTVAQRQDMLVEAASIIRELDSARLWDSPKGGVPIAIAVSGEKSVAQFAPLADHLVAVEPDQELIKAWNREQRSRNTRKIGQVPICWDPDQQRAIERAHDQSRWFGGGFAVNADLPTPAGFEGASKFVRPEDVAEQIPCGLLILMRLCRQCSRTGKPAALILRLCRSATRDRRPSSSRRPGLCWTGCVEPPVDQSAICAMRAHPVASS